MADEVGAYLKERNKDHCASMKAGDKCPFCGEGIVGTMLGTKQLECKTCFKSMKWEGKVNPSVGQHMFVEDHASV
eukprot:g30850.t1